jgi:hypothetical protein
MYPPEVSLYSLCQIEGFKGGDLRAIRSHQETFDLLLNGADAHAFLILCLEIWLAALAA